MPKQSRKGQARKLSDETLKRLAQSLKVIRKDETPVYKGNERVPLAAIRRAYATILLHGTRLIHQAGKEWGLAGDVVALRFHRGDPPNYVLAEPLDKYDKYAPDQAELVWDDERKVARLDMLYILQPMNKVVAPGYVLEIPITLQALPGLKHPFLMFHLVDGELREEKEGAPRTSKKGTEDGTGSRQTASAKQGTGEGGPEDNQADE